MGKIFEDCNLIEHLPSMPKGRVLLDDTAKVCWKHSSSDTEGKQLMSILFGGTKFPIPIGYPESHHFR